MQAFGFRRHQARRLQDARHNGDEQEGAIGVSRGKIRKEAAKVTRLENSPRDTRYFSFASASSKTYDTAKGGTSCQGSFVA